LCLFRAIRTDEINACKDSIAEENKAQWMATSWETLIQAKKENVALQLESAYRERLQEVYSQASYLSKRGEMSPYEKAL